MNPIRNTGGSFPLCAAEYPIDSATAIKRGAVVKVSGGKIVAVTAADAGRVAGIAAEDHTGSADALNQRSNGKRILVYDNPGLISEAAAPVEAAIAGGSATTVLMSTLGAFSNDDFNGGCLVLVEKAANSTNTDVIGAVKPITDYSYTSTGTVSTFTVPDGGTPTAGDRYAIYPPVGFAKGNYGDDRLDVVLTATASIGLKVCGADTERGRVKFCAKLHELGVEE